MVVFQFVPKLISHIHVLYAAVVICSTLVNIRHTHRHHLTNLFDKLSQLSQKRQVRY